VIANVRQSEDEANGRSMFSHFANFSMMISCDLFFAPERTHKMFTRTITLVVVLSVLSSGRLFSQQPTVFSPEEQTGVIMLRMTGDLAREYAQRTGSIDGDGIPGNVSISATAVIAQRLRNNQVRIEHSASVKREGRPDRLVTLTATVDEENIRSLVRTVFGGEFRFSNSPGTKNTDKSPSVTAHHLAVPLLSLANLSGVKLQTWTLESEISE